MRKSTSTGGVIGHCFSNDGPENELGVAFAFAVDNFLYDQHLPPARGLRVRAGKGDRPAFRSGDQQQDEKMQIIRVERKYPLGHFGGSGSIRARQK